jgi:hypothetical protein|tara:strand:+ start:1208 stop:1369 length:162 start_codon:yes stop_codon:yes gene_type:complete
MKQKKQTKKSWAEEHLIIECEGLSKKQKDELRDRIMERVANKFDKKGNARGTS